MNRAKKFILPSAVFLTGLILLVGVDIVLRYIFSTNRGLGMQENIWFASQILLGTWSSFLFWRNDSSQTNLGKLRDLALYLFILAILYVLIIYGYVFGTEIDGF